MLFCSHKERQMLSQDRQERILDFLDREGSGSIKQLSQVIGTSESTIRRDLKQLDANGLLTKVYGGATRNDRRVRTEEPDMLKKHNLFAEEKERIGRYAASLVSPGDFVFIDGGTTTEAVIRYLEEKDAVYMTNGLFQAQLLTGRGFETLVVGGTVRPVTEAIVGEEAVKQIRDCNFSLGFFGTNGITAENGFTTPNIIEAGFKNAALEQTLNPFVLADPSKFGRIYPKTFAHIDEAQIITTELYDKSYKNHMRIKEVDVDLYRDL